MTASMFFHYLIFPAEKTARSLKSMTELIHMSPLSLSVAYDESNYNNTYPEMKGLGRMDFIYEQ